MKTYLACVSKWGYLIDGEMVIQKPKLIVLNFKE